MWLSTYSWQETLKISVTELQLHGYHKWTKLYFIHHFSIHGNSCYARSRVQPQSINSSLGRNNSAATVGKWFQLSTNLQGFYTSQIISEWQQDNVWNKRWCFKEPNACTVGCTCIPFASRCGWQETLKILLLLLRWLQLTVTELQLHGYHKWTKLYFIRHFSTYGNSCYARSRVQPPVALTVSTRHSKRKHSRTI